MSREEGCRRNLVHKISERRRQVTLDRPGDLVLVGRVPRVEVNAGELPTRRGEAHEALGAVGPALARAAFAREKKR